MTSTSVNVLITGANRGIGRCFVERYLSRPNHIVIAAVRDPSAAESDLNSLPKGKDSKLFVVKIVSDDFESPKHAIGKLISENPDELYHLDIVIANAGMCGTAVKPGEVTMEEMQKHFNVNTLGPLALYHATSALLERSTLPDARGRFVAISSIGASLALETNIPVVYSTSKAALNMVVRQIHHADERIVAFVLHPGWLQSDMGNAYAKSLQQEQAPTTIPEGVDGMLKVLDASTREQTSGHFIDYEGNTVAW
ncbi:hypothetical protein KEM55_003020 [Ascosphaera atra]|nr:hypothetical protein KEM55_003020 [Ascosphaera atra]